MGRRGEVHQDKKPHDRLLVDGVFIRMFSVMLLGLMSTMLSTVIDAVFTGQFLGSRAVAAMGFVGPVIFLSNVVTGLFTAGTNQLCTRYMGKADVSKVNQVFSTMSICSMTVCLISGVLIFFLSPLYVSLATKGVDEQTAAMTLDYLRGFSFIIPAVGISVLLSGLMPLDNDQMRGIGFAAIMLGMDVVLDLVNVTVIHGGMLGMALASVISCYMGLFWLLLHFRKKGHLLEFQPGNLCFSDVREVLSYGLAGAIPMIMNSVRGVCFNAVLLKEGGAEAVTAYSAAGGAFVMISAFIVTVQGTTASVSGLSYGEQDVAGLERTFKNALSVSYRIYLVFGVILMIGADFIAKIFLNDASAVGATGLAAGFIRFLTVQNLLVIFSYIITGIFTGTGRVKLNYLIGVLRDGFFPCAAILLMGSAFGIPGVKASFVVTGILTVISCFAIPVIMNRRLPAQLKELMILPESFEPDPEEYLDGVINSMDEAVRLSERAYRFCIQRGEDTRTAQLVSLFIEEMGGNAIKHGIGSVRNGIVEVRLILNEEKRLIRIKDNGRPFDPVSWNEQNHPSDPAANIGIRMIVGLAKDIQYVPAMSINNLLLYL